MAINTTTLLALEELFSESIGDWLEFDTTTNITTNTSIVSTTLNQYDDGENDHFNNWWVYITEGNNVGVHRKISDYATSGGILTVYGANLSAEAGAVTCRLHRYNRDTKVNAINRAIERIYPALHKKLDDMTLITDNALPDGSFESWSSTTALTHYTASAITFAQTSTGGLVRNGTYSVKATAGATDDYYYISSDSYPRLLDLMGRTINFKCWAYPEVADDTTIVIYTLQADGTAQTLTSTTSCPAGQWTLIELESQALNDDLVEIQFRFYVATDTKYAYFDDARVIGRSIREYLLPDDFVLGHVSQVLVQTSGYSDEPCDDLLPVHWDWQNHSIYNDGTNVFLRLKEYNTSAHRIRLRGYKPLETLSADTDTITLEAHRIPLLIAQAKVIFWELEETPVAINDVARFQFKANQAKNDLNDLFPRLSMPKPAEKIR